MASSPAYLSPADLLKQARTIAAQELAASRVPIDQAAAAAAKQNDAHGQAIQGFSGALADILGGLKPSVEAPYDAAATRTATFAKGYSDGLRMKSQGAADQTNQFLQNVVGAPEGQMVSPDSATAAGDAAYGFGGYIPASTLEREGAAYSAAAGLLPGYARLQGQQDFTSNLFAGRDQQKTFEDQIAQLTEQRPKLINDVYSQLADLQIKQRAQDVNERIAAAQFGETVRHNKAGEANVAASYQVALKRAGIAEQEAQIKAAQLQAKLANGGFSAQEVQKFQGQAISGAKAAFQGSITTDKAPLYDVDKPNAAGWSTPVSAPDGTVIGYRNHHPQLGYGDAVQAGLAQGIPLSILLPALNQWYKPGVRGRPLSKAQQKILGAGGGKAAKAAAAAAAKFLAGIGS